MADQQVVCMQSDIDSVIAEREAAAVAQALSPFKSKQQTGYFSTVRFRFLRTGAGPTFTYTCAAGTKRVAFSYSVDDVMDAAGFAPGTQATGRYTNLSDANKTRDGERYYIKGIALYRGATSDALLSAMVWDTAAMTLVMNTDSLWPLGCLHFFPSTSGLSGRGFTNLSTPPLDASQTDLQLLQNSHEDANAYFSFQEPLVWYPSGNTNSSLSMIFNFPQDMVITSTARAAAAGVAPFDPPAEGAMGTYVDLTIRLIGWSIANANTNK